MGGVIDCVLVTHTKLELGLRWPYAGTASPDSISYSDERETSINVYHCSTQLFELDLDLE